MGRISYKRDCLSGSFVWQPRLFALLPVMIVAVLSGHQEKHWISYWSIHKSFFQLLFHFQSSL